MVRWIIPARRLRNAAFTMVELLVSTAVLALLILLVAQLFSSATAVTTLGEKRMDADAQARAVLDRMTIDFSRMLKRTDVSYFLKTPAETMVGNDQIAFFSEVPGYSPGGPQSPLSLVSYRLNQSLVQLERMGKGLVWNGVASGIPMVFRPLTLAATWPAATTQDADPDYELIGPQVFRFEYGYLLKGRRLPDGSSLPSMFSVTPWDTRAPLAHTDVQGFRDVAAIIVHLAVLDPKSNVLASNEDLRTLAGSMVDFSATQQPGELVQEWQDAVDSSGLPGPVVASVRLYQRSIPLIP